MGSRRIDAFPVDPPPEDRERQGFITRLQTISREVAFDPRAWSPSLAREVGAIFDGRAATWWTHRSPEYFRPLAEAIDAAGAFGGVCIDIGSGISLHEETLRARFDRVVAIDLSAEMLRLADRSGTSLVRADASALPIRAKSVDLVVCVNMFLFAAEYTRVLRAGGAIIFVSTSGDRTPIYLSPRDVNDALVTYGDARFATVSGTSGDACWTIARRSER
ncbi:MAG: class I SAM-dependent methyltransferase [Acidimicrobiales bacterium]